MEERKRRPETARRETGELWRTRPSCINQNQHHTSQRWRFFARCERREMCRDGCSTRANCQKSNHFRQKFQRGLTEITSIRSLVTHYLYLLPLSLMDRWLSTIHCRLHAQSTRRVTKKSSTLSVSCVSIDRCASAARKRRSMGSWGCKDGLQSRTQAQQVALGL